MSGLIKRLCRPGYDLQKEQAIQEAIIEIRELRAKIEAMEKMEAALRIAVRQNSHDMLMTGSQLRQCEAALEESK